jgi:uncharacterized protein (TIGR00369 family)
MRGEYGDAIRFPPNCFLDMRAKIVRYESRKLLVVRIPVHEESFNPVGVMQGGYIAAAFDNAIGPLSYMAARKPCMTIDLHTQFIRAVGPGDTLTVTARVVSQGAITMVLAADAYNARQKLAALATATVVVEPKTTHPNPL